MGMNDPDEAIDFIMVADAIDTAFTDFSTHVKFQPIMPGSTGRIPKPSSRA